MDSEDIRHLTLRVSIFVGTSGILEFLSQLQDFVMNKGRVGAALLLLSVRLLSIITSINSNNYKLDGNHKP